MEDSIDRTIRQMQGMASTADLHAASIIGRIHRISRFAQGRATEILSNAGLNRGEYDVLGVLFRHGKPLAPTAIAGELSSSLPGMTKRLHKLETGGFIERRPHETDRRSALVESTPRGTELYPVLFAQITHLEAELVATLAGETHASVNSALRQILSGLES